MGPPVSICEYHHDILNAWAAIRRARETPMRLITFDFHTDTLPAFNHYALRKLELDLGRVPTRAEHAALGARLVAGLDFRSADSVKNAVAHLRHDEHIDAARRAGIISDIAIILSTDAPGNLPSFALVLPAPTPICGVICGVGTPSPTGADPKICGVGTPSPTGADPKICGVGTPEQVAAGMLESAVLEPKVAAIAEVWGGLGEYVVDIDLDFFRSEAAAAPRDATVFCALLAGAVAVTIARESRCVLEGRLEGESITADSLYAQLRSLVSV